MRKSLYSWQNPIEEMEDDKVKTVTSNINEQDEYDNILEEVYEEYMVKNDMGDIFAEINKEKNIKEMNDL